MFLSKDLVGQLIKTHTVVLKDIPGFQYEVRLRPLSPRQAMEYSGAGYDSSTEDGLRAMADLARLCIVDEDGQPVFDADDDVADLVPFKALEYITAEALKLNGMDAEDAEGN